MDFLIEWQEKKETHKTVAKAFRLEVGAPHRKDVHKFNFPKQLSLDPWKRNTTNLEASVYNISPI